MALIYFRSLIGLVLVQALSATAYGANRESQTVDSVLRSFSKRQLLSGNLLVQRGSKKVLRLFANADDTRGIPNGADTRFILGSTSKQFVTTAILKLVDLGLLNVNDPLGKFLPEYPKKNLTGADGRQVLVRHLMNNTSGIPDAYEDPRISAKLYKRPIFFSELLNAIRMRPLKFPPGQTFEYSNTGFILLGEVVRRVAGMGFGEFLNSLLVPLNLRKTSVGLPSPGTPVARGYHKLEKGRTDFNRFFQIREIHLQDHFTDGNIVSTVEDLARWVRLLTSGQILSKDSTRAMFHTQSPSEYAFGWFVHQQHHGHLLYEHAGEWLSYQSWIRHYPKLDLTIVWVSNQKMEGLLQNFIDTLSNALLSLQPSTANVSHLIAL